MMLTQLLDALHQTATFFWGYALDIKINRRR